MSTYSIGTSIELLTYPLSRDSNNNLNSTIQKTSCLAQCAFSSIVGLFSAAVGGSIGAFSGLSTGPEGIATGVFIGALGCGFTGFVLGCVYIVRKGQHQVIETPLLNERQVIMPQVRVCGEKSMQIERFKQLAESNAPLQLIKACDRFSDALPTEKARVYLQDGTPTNASKVWGNFLIQGPSNKEQACLMWRIIVEYKISTIVRIGADNLKKGSCICYTPTPEMPIVYKKHGIEIRQSTADNKKQISESIVKHNYEIKHEDLENLVYVYEVNKWPDHDSTDLSILNKLIEEINESGGPILIHCKAGIGRSGTVATCLKIDQDYRTSILAEQEQIFDPAALVEELRTYRSGAVNTISQFEMIINFIDSMNFSQSVLF